MAGGYTNMHDGANFVLSIIAAYEAFYTSHIYIAACYYCSRADTGDRKKATCGA